jgi:uncharacterized membrane protein YkvA (DUF1232 family)
MLGLPDNKKSKKKSKGKRLIVNMKARFSYMIKYFNAARPNTLQETKTV